MAEPLHSRPDHRTAAGTVPAGAAPAGTVSPLAFGWNGSACQRGLLCLATVLVLATPVVAQDEEEGPAPPERILAAEPTTVEGNFEAALLMLQLARPELANRYVEQLLELDPSDEDLLELRTKHGTGTFLELTRVPAVEENASELLDRLNAAAQRHISAPGYIEGLFRNLSGTARQREEALRELRHLGPYAVPPMVKELQDGNFERDVIAHAMSRLGSDIVPPLIGALTSPHETVRAVTAEVIGRVGSEAEIVWLWRLGFSEEIPAGTQRAAREAIARLKFKDPRRVNRVNLYGIPRQMLVTATEHFTGRYEWPELLYGDSSEIPVWTWDDEEQTVVEHRVSRKSASLHFAERLAREATELAPTNEDAPLLVLAILLARDIEEAGWSEPVPIGPGTAHDQAVLSGPEACSAVLQLSLDQGVVSSALGSIRALALNGSRSQLHAGRGRPPILEALNAPHPRVQFAAAITILQWEPLREFPGASRVVEILARTLHIDSAAGGVVIDPNVGRGTVTVGTFGELGYRPMLTTTGMEGFRLAARRGDVELAVLHPNVIRWELTQTLTNFRADARTASIPVVIYGPLATRQRYENISETFRNVAFVTESVSALEVHQQLRPFLAQLSPPPLTQRQRDELRTTAAFWLRRIAVRNQTDIFDLSPAESALSRAIDRPAIAEDALIALGAIPRPSVQQRLLDVATQANMEGDLRQLAALQLAFNIQRYGMLLKEAEVTALRAAWQAESEPLVRTALASVIGSLKPSPQALRRQILARPMSPAPVETQAEPEE
jgi:hypothetical protein